MHKIKYYIDDVVREQIIQIAIKDYYLTQKERVFDLMALFCVGNLLNISGPINRNHEFVFNFDGTPIPTEFNTSDTFTETSLKTAEDIWSVAGNKKVCVFWSGGIDSTVALVALMMTNSDWLNRIRIYTSEYAIREEYPLFYDIYLKNADVVMLKNLEFFDKKLFDLDLLPIDGTCGDQIWGCNIMRDMGEMRKQHYSKLYNHNEFYLHTEKHKRLYITIDYIEQQIEKFPVPIKTVADLYWMLTFTHKWDHVKSRAIAAVNDITIFDNKISFFNSLYYQRWAMSNLDVKLGDTWNTYKQPAKDFIYEFTGDNEYRVNKLQHESMGRSVEPVKHLIRGMRLVTTNGHLINMDESKCEELLRECYVKPIDI